MMETKGVFLEQLNQLTAKLEQGDEPVLPSQQAIDECVGKLSTKVPSQGVGLEGSFRELVDDIVPGLNNQSQKHYYGFVTGGITPAAHLADNLVTLMDQNVQVYLPNETAATVVEDCALKMMLDLLQLEQADFSGRTFTTGATASNVLGLACGREAVLTKRLQAKGINSGVAELGIFDAMTSAGVNKIQVLSCMSHSSNGKAAAIVGLGRDNVIEVRHPTKPWDFDLDSLEQYLQKPNTASIVSVNFGEVNTGMFTSNVAKIRQLCDKYDAWMHIDGAFGMFARVLLNTDSKYAKEAEKWVSGLELADSITGDNHKTLNVPYDCGFFFIRSKELLQTVFQNAGAAYLKGSSDASVASPLHIGIENSRRFRALPVYATLRAYGKQGYRQFVEQLITHTREIAQFVSQSDKYELLPEGATPSDLSTVVLVSANDESLNAELKQRINATQKMYVSGTVFNNRPAVRIAISNWHLGPGDSELPISILSSM